MRTRRWRATVDRVRRSKRLRLQISSRLRLSTIGARRRSARIDRAAEDAQHVRGLSFLVYVLHDVGLPRRAQRQVVGSTLLQRHVDGAERFTLLPREVGARSHHGSDRARRPNDLLSMRAVQLRHSIR